jgi:hypothetical protein
MMPNTDTSAVVPTLPRRDVALWVAVIALLALAVSPVLTRSHVEGFTYFTETLSILLPDLSRADPLWTLTRDFFYMSRPGVIWAMAPLSDLSPGNGYDLLMWLAMPVFLSGVVLAARLAGGASWLASVAALLVLPIALEANFFTNDNLIAGGLSLWTMVLLLARRGMAFAVLAGGLYSLAVLCRLDQVLLAPFFAVLAILPALSFRWAVGRWAAMAVGFGIVHGLFALLDPQAANLLLRIAVVTEADATWSRDTATIGLMILRDAAAALMAIGVGLPAIIAGAFVLGARARAAAQHASGSFDAVRIWAMPLLLIGYPFVIYGLTVGKYYDPRGFITMLPMLAPLAAIGLDRWVVGPLRRAPRRDAGSRSRHGERAHGGTPPAAGLRAGCADPACGASASRRDRERAAHHDRADLVRRRMARLAGAGVSSARPGGREACRNPDHSAGGGGRGGSRLERRPPPAERHGGARVRTARGDRHRLHTGGRALVPSRRREGASRPNAYTLSPELGADLGVALRRPWRGLSAERASRPALCPRPDWCPRQPQRRCGAPLCQIPMAISG